MNTSQPILLRVSWTRHCPVGKIQPTPLCTHLTDPSRLKFNEAVTGRGCILEASTVEQWGLRTRAENATQTKMLHRLGTGTWRKAAKLPSSKLKKTWSLDPFTLRAWESTTLNWDTDWMMSRRWQSQQQPHNRQMWLDIKIYLNKKSQSNNVQVTDHVHLCPEISMDKERIQLFNIDANELCCNIRWLTVVWAWLFSGAGNKLRLVPKCPQSSWSQQFVCKNSQANDLSRHCHVAVTVSVIWFGRKVGWKDRNARLWLVHKHINSANNVISYDCDSFDCDVGKWRTDRKTKRWLSSVSKRSAAHAPNGAALGRSLQQHATWALLGRHSSVPALPAEMERKGQHTSGRSPPCSLCSSASLQPPWA